MQLHALERPLQQLIKAERKEAGTYVSSGILVSPRRSEEGEEGRSDQAPTSDAPKVVAAQGVDF